MVRRRLVHQLQTIVLRSGVKRTLILMPSRKSIAALILSLTLLLAFSCARLHAGAPFTEVSMLANGIWGGEHVILNVSKSGAEVEFDCAHGQITQAIALDKHGDFKATGTFTPEHSGPVRRDEDTPPTPATYAGHVEGDSMNLTVTLGKENIGSFTLAL